MMIATRVASDESSAPSEEGRKLGRSRRPPPSPTEIVEEAVRGGDPARAIELLSASWSGPIPRPEDLAGYNEVMPGLAGRLVSMAEEQSRHRQSIEKTVVRGSVTTLRRGQLFAFIVAMTAIIAGAILIASGYDSAGLATILVPLAPMIAAFAYNQVRGERSNQD